MKSPLLVALLGTVAIGMTAPAVAGDRRGDRAERHWEEMDKDGDGTVTQAEARAAADERFERADVNNDGKLTKDEAEDSRKLRRAERRQERFSKMDKNGDGKIAEDEFEGRKSKHFSKIDANEDGFLTKEEMEQHHAKKKGHRWHRGDE